MIAKQKNPLNSGGCAPFTADKPHPLASCVSTTGLSFCRVEGSTIPEQDPRLARLNQLIPNHGLSPDRLREILAESQPTQIGRLIRGSLHPGVVINREEYAVDRELIKDLSNAQLKVLYLALARFLSGEGTVERELEPALKYFQRREAQGVHGDSVGDDWKKALYLEIQIAEEREHRKAFEDYIRNVIHPHNREGNHQDLERNYLSTKGASSFPFRFMFDSLLPRVLNLLGKVEPDTVNGKLALISAFVIYHGFAESIIARTAYEGFHIALGGEELSGVKQHDKLPTLLKVFGGIAKDEERHVKFGMDVLREELGKGYILNRFAYTGWACFNIAGLSLVTAGIVAAVFLDGIGRDKGTGYRMYRIFPFKLSVGDLAGEAWKNTGKLLSAVLPPVVVNGGRGISKLFSSSKDNSRPPGA